MTKREYYDLLIQSATDGTFPSYNGDMCVYRGPGKAKCAVGLLIPDEKYSSYLEGKPVYLDSIQSKLEFPSNITISDLIDIQGAHDSLASKVWNSDLFINKIKSLACFKEFQDEAS